MFVTMTIKLPVSATRERFQQVIAEAASVSAAYGVTLRVPGSIKGNDVRAIAILRGIAEGTPIAGDNLSGKLVKSADRENEIKAAMGTTLNLMVGVPEWNPRPIVFGTAISTGPLIIHARGARIKDERKFLDRYLGAPYGSAVPISFNANQVTVTRGEYFGPRLLVKAEAGGQ